MPPFRSRLFNWIFRSFPFQWGRRVRQALQRWLQTIPKNVGHWWLRTTPVYGQQNRSALPPWQRFLTKREINFLTAPSKAIARLSRTIVPSRWQQLLAEAINYFLRRPKLSPREQEYAEESSPWPPLPPPSGQITEVEITPEDSPLHAWIEIPATSLGYAYSPLVNFLLWLDQLIARLEEYFIRLWRRFWLWLTTCRPI